MPCKGTAAATSSSTPSGTGSACSAGTTTSSAYEPRASAHATRSPTAKPLTPSPTASTVPAPSAPGTCGNGIGYTPDRSYDVPEIHPGRGRPHQQLPRPRLWIRLFDQGKDVRAAGLISEDRAHIHTLSGRVGAAPREGNPGCAVYRRPSADSDPWLPLESPKRDPGEQRGPGQRQQNPPQPGAHGHVARPPGVDQVDGGRHRCVLQHVPECIRQDVPGDVDARRSSAG